MWWPGGNTWLLFGKTSTDMPADLVPFNQIYTQVHWKSWRKLTRLMPVHQTCQLTVWNFIRQDCCLVECYFRELLRCCSCNIYAWWPSVFTATNTAAVQICLLVECCCKMDACSILHVSWCCASLSAIPVGMVSHYQPCLLVGCLTIGHTFWCGASMLALLCWCGA